MFVENLGSTLLPILYFFVTRRGCQRICSYFSVYMLKLKLIFFNIRLILLYILNFWAGVIFIRLHNYFWNMLFVYIIGNLGSTFLPILYFFSYKEKVSAIFFPYFWVNMLKLKLIFFEFKVKSFVDIENLNRGYLHKVT